MWCAYRHLIHLPGLVPASVVMRTRIWYHRLRVRIPLGGMRTLCARYHYWYPYLIGSGTGTTMGNCTVKEFEVPILVLVPALWDTKKSGSGAPTAPYVI